MLEDFLTLPKDRLKEHLGFGKDDPYLHIDRGGRILCVAHIDTVFDYRWSDVVSKDNQNSDRAFMVRLNNIIISPLLDDRIGVFTAERFASSNNEDLLITDDEERVLSTASLFLQQHLDRIKQYNWIVEFDRRGTTPVTYGNYFECDEMIAAVESVWKRIDHGSYTDIVELVGAGVGAFNVGIGYHNEHTLVSYLDISEYKLAVERFKTFYSKYRKTRFRFDPTSTRDWWKFTRYYDYYVGSEDVYHWPVRKKQR